jgi:hypothetical protein
MRLSGLLLALSAVIVASGCSVPDDGEFRQGSIDNCSGVIVAVNFGVLAPERTSECVEFSAETAPAKDLLDFLGLSTEGTGTYGDQIVCRVNGLPSPTEAFQVEGEEPHLESCADMPPAFAYWALWVKTDQSVPWSYAEEGVGTLTLEPGTSLGLVFSTGGETPTPTDP